MHKRTNLQGGVCRDVIKILKILPSDMKRIQISARVECPMQ